jgi:hypothetical protein
LKGYKSAAPLYLAISHAVQVPGRLDCTGIHEMLDA